MELTEFGERFLDRALSARSVGDAGAAEVAQGGRISALEERLEELEEIVQSHDDVIQKIQEVLG